MAVRITTYTTGPIHDLPLVSSHIGDVMVSKLIMSAIVRRSIQKSIGLVFATSPISRQY
jgi:hypothetical protein